MAAAASRAPLRPCRDHAHADLLCEGDRGVSESLTDHLAQYVRAQRGSGIALPDVVPAVGMARCGYRIRLRG
jgi:hypothetical protein